MTLKSFFYLSMGIVFSANAFAQSPQREIIYSDKTLPFAEWVSSSPNEAAILNLYPGFKEPTVQVTENGVVKAKELKMVIYATRSRTYANRASNSIKLADLISGQSIQKLDPGSKSKAIHAAETMPVVAGHGRISNFLWCNTTQGKDSRPDILLPSLEGSLTAFSRPGRSWCAPDPKANCFESCRIFPDNTPIRGVVTTYNMVKNPGKDLGIATQSEARYYNSESELGVKFPLSSLTKIDTPVAGVLEISIFYFNQVMVFGKILVILQPNPKNTQQTLLTGLTAFGVRADVWNHQLGGERVRALLRSNYVMNDASGILAGIPVFTKNALTGLTQTIENQP